MKTFALVMFQNMIIAMLVLCCFIFLMPKYVLADSNNNELTIVLQYDISGAEFSIYKIADISDSDEYVAVSPYDEYSFDLNVSDSESVKELIKKIENCIDDNGVEPYATGIVDSDGSLTFNNLEKGLYIIIGNDCKKNNTIYTPVSSLVRVPEKDDDGSYIYQVTVYPKYDSTDEKETEETTSENTEETTTKTTQETTSENTEETTDTSDTTVNISETTESVSAGGTDNEKLPQTGMLWWPVPTLAAAGIIVFAFGWRRHNMADKENEE